VLFPSVFPIIVDDFGGSSSVKGNTGPFWVASGLAVFSALIVIFFVKPLTHDGMKEEDAKVRGCLSCCLHKITFPPRSSGNTSKSTAMMFHPWVLPKLKPWHRTRKGKKWAMRRAPTFRVGLSCNCRHPCAPEHFLEASAVSLLCVTVFFYSSYGVGPYAYAL